MSKPNTLPDQPMTNFDTLRVILNIAKEYSEDVEPEVIVAAIEAVYDVIECPIADGCGGECTCKAVE